MLNCLAGPIPANTALGTIWPRPGLRLLTVGWPSPGTPAGHTVRYVVAVGLTAVTLVASAYVLAKPSGSLIVRPSGRSRERSASIVVTDASFRMARLMVPVYSG